MDEKTASEVQIRANWEEIRQLVAAAAARSGRPSDSVRIVGVTKYVDAAAAKSLYDAGCVDLGESRPQSLWDKALHLPNAVRWHLIGHLQRNKSKRTLPCLALIHSLDSWRLGQQLAQDASELGRPAEALLEINLTEDTTKTGLGTAAAEAWLDMYVSSEAVRNHLLVGGLMGMSSLQADAGQTRREFASLRELRERWSRRFGLPLETLSMGMSDDFELAIEEGSTMVRIGSRLFRSREDA
jgi:PLP dependent protein